MHLSVRSNFGLFFRSQTEESSFILPCLCSSITIPFFKKNHVKSINICMDAQCKCTVLLLIRETISEPAVLA